MIKAKFEGGRDLEKQLLKLKRTTAKGVVRRTAKKALEPARDKAIGFAPVGYVDDIHLNEHISISTKARRARKKNPVEVYMGVDVALSSVGVNQEWGNENHAAQPFMRPAWSATKYTVLDGFGKMMWIEVRKSIERAERKASRNAG